MSKKASKKGSKKGKTKLTAPVEDNEPWVEELKTLNINDDDWDCNVSLLMSSDTDNMCYVMAFNDLFICGKNVRPRIKIISNASLACATLETNYNYGDQKSDAATLSPYVKLCQESLKYCNTDGFSMAIPVELLASLIKYYLYDIKLKSHAESQLLEEYEKRRKIFQDESAMQLQNIIKRTPVSKKEKHSPKKSQKSGVKGAPAKFTTLRKRNEKFFDDKIVQDESSPRPKMFIILTSFIKAELPLELLKLQIPLVAVIKLHDIISEETGSTVSTKENKHFCYALNVSSIRTKVIRPRRYSNPNEETYLHNLKIKSFWNNFQKILSNKDNVLYFKDTMFFKFYPEISLKKLAEDNSLKQLNARSLGIYLRDLIYNQFCFLQFDLQDLKRQHENYNQHLVIQNVEEKKDFDSNKIQFYTSVMDLIPSEIVNIPLILHGILLQLEESLKNVENSSVGSTSISEIDKEVVKKNIVKKDLNLYSLLNTLDETYDLFSQENIIPEKSTFIPTVLVEGDELGSKTYWQDQNKSVKMISCNILQCFWDKYFRRHLPLYEDSFASNNGHTDEDLFQLLKASGDLTFFHKLSNLPCLFHELLVEDKADVFCSESPPKDLFENLYSKYQYDDQDTIDNRKLPKFHHYSNPSEGYFLGQIFDDHSYCFEEMTSDVLLQSLFKSYESFNCLDIKQDYFRNNFFLKFHNRVTCCNKEYLMGSLRTPTGLRDFYDYTVDEEFYWLNEQELSYINSLNKEEENKLAYDYKQLRHLQNKIRNRTEQICAETNFFRSDSLKSEKKPEHDLYSLSSLASRLDSESTNNNYVCKFLEAYDIDLPNRVQFSESRQEIISSVNSKLLIKKLSRLYGDDAVFLQITIFSHTLYFFKPKSKTIDTYFHLLHESGMIFYFKKNLISDVSNVQSKSGVNNGESKDGKYATDTKLTAHPIEDQPLITEGENGFKTLLYHLSLSLPNSLYLEVVNPKHIPFYIKQYYLSTTARPSEIKTESFRCSLLDGTLMRFMNDGSIIIFYPNSEIYYCRKILIKSSPSTSVEGILSDIKDTIQKEQIPDSSKVKGKETTQKNKPPTNPGKTKEKIQPGGKSEKNKNGITSNDDFSPSTLRLKKCFSAVVESFECTLTTGRRISIEGEKRVELEPLFSKSYTDLLKGINVMERYDGTRITHNFEGTLTVEFPDGSRITTFAKFGKDEIFIVPNESVYENEESIENNNKISPNNEDQSSHDNYLETSTLSSQGFVTVEMSYLTEHPNFASISADSDAEGFNIYLPLNVCVNLTSEGLYTMNFDEKAELLVKDELVFQELNSENFPKYTLHLNNIYNETLEKRSDSNDETSESLVQSILTCEDDKGCVFEVDYWGDIYIKGNDSIKSICQCATVNKNRLFIVNNQFSGLEVFSPYFLDGLLEEAKTCKSWVAQNYSSTDHQVLLLLKPLLQSDYEKHFFKEFRKLNFFTRFSKPSTYNDKHTNYNPFPKFKKIEDKVETPEVILVRLINRVNCNIHWLKRSFLQNKMEVDLLRKNRYPHLAIELHKRGNVPFCRADKMFIEYIKDAIIGRMISRVRRRVVKHLEYKKTKEYEKVLRERKLIPYFYSAQGNVHLIILEILGLAIEGSCANESGGSRLEKLFKVPLDLLTDDDLDFMHDKIAQFTVSNICSCITNKLACRLRILLLAGRTLHGLIPDMISVFYLYAENMKRKRLVEEENKHNSNLLQELLMRPLHLLTEGDFQIVHDRLKNLPYCTCTKYSEKCKLKMLLLASAVLNDYFPNLDSVFKSPTFDIIV